MKRRKITEDIIKRFRKQLILEEKSVTTIDKYCRDVKMFFDYAGDSEITKETVVAYKAELMGKDYTPRSINSMLAAINKLFSSLGWYELKVKTIKIQRQIYCPEEKELTKAEYYRLISTARAKCNHRLALIIQTICGTGIRVSELEFITVEAARRGEAIVSCKGKTRTVFIVRDLQRQLLKYAFDYGIITGGIFITRNGHSISRTNIWREMKDLCNDACVNPEKVYPHNLRHLFARVFYSVDKDLAKLADILGHSNIETTRIYIISTGAEHRRRMERMHLII